MEPGVFYFIFNKNAAWGPYPECATRASTRPEESRFMATDCPVLSSANPIHPEKKSFLPAYIHQQITLFPHQELIWILLRIFFKSKNGTGSLLNSEYKKTLTNTV